MPLHDHFHPPLSNRRHFDSFLNGWGEAIVRGLNAGPLPKCYFAELHVVGGISKIAGPAVHALPQPMVTAPLDFTLPEFFEVQVFQETGGPRLVAAIELVSPANKDRPSNRRSFAIKCASYLQDRVGLIIVDVVTERHASLHRELLELLRMIVSTPGQGAQDLYATAYRSLAKPSGEMHLDIWAEALTVGGPLPTLPLWIAADQSIPLDLESTYDDACVARRIVVNGEE
ncbi:MAG: DUF4058 family protein [Gemmataceae bacterium]|nr:DUF4058 family protein [Gemmataceae bacterium]